MKILILANNDVGLYRFRKELIEELIDKGNRISISLPYGELVEPLKKIGCCFWDTPINRRSINPFYDIRLLLKYQSLVKKERPDIVITYTIKPNIYGCFVCRINHIPYAMNITGVGTTFQKTNVLQKIVIILYKLASKKAKVVFFENSSNRDIFIKSNIIEEEQSCVLNGAGINTVEYPFLSYPKNEIPVRFLFVGRIMREKGINELYYVAKKTKNKYQGKVEFDIVGPYEDDYKEATARLVEEGIIYYYGYQENTVPFIKQCHCLILPSYHEGMANILLECGSMGRPMIASNINGCKETIIHGESGFLCEAKNKESLFLAVEEFFLLRYSKKIDMGKSSRKHIENIFEKNSVVRNTCDRLFHND